MGIRDLSVSVTSQDLRTSTVQTSDLHFAHGVSLNIQQSGSPNGHEESQLSPRSQLPPSDFLLLAQYVGIVLEKHHSASGLGIWHAFGGDIKAACENKSETGPFKTISLFVYESDLSTTNELLRKGVSRNGWSLKVTEGIVEYKDEAKTISAPIGVYAGTPRHGSPVVKMPGPSGIYLPIYQAEPPSH
ncbi:hypothetical protein H0H93_004244 [Arthromyces matolae]|nr:hypothetical protein H0H93_004244 [Arthromyces matolae]